LETLVLLFALAECVQESVAVLLLLEQVRQLAAHL